MAGETTTSSRIASGGGVQLTKIPARSAANEIWDYVTYELSTGELEADDVIQMLPVQKGAIILEVILAVDDLDDDGTPAVVLSVGDASDDDRFITASAAGQAGGVSRLNNVAGLLYKYTADDTIDLKVQTVPDSAVAGTVTLAVCMSFANQDSL